MNERELIPISPIGEELEARFQQFAFRTNPNDSPMARALLAHGYKVTIHPLEPSYTQEDWLVSQVSMGGMKIIFRQPTPRDLWVCFMERESTVRSMASALVGLVDFFAFCRDYCPEIDYVGGSVSKYIENKGLDMEKSIKFYHRFLGCVECYQKNELLSIYAKVHLQERFDRFPIWNWRKKKVTACINR